MLLLIQLQKRGNTLYKFPLWRWPAPLLNIAKVPIGNPKLFGGIPEIQLRIFSLCADKRSKGHSHFLLSRVVRSTANALFIL